MKQMAVNLLIVQRIYFSHFFVGSFRCNERQKTWILVIFWIDFQSYTFYCYTDVDSPICHPRSQRLSGNRSMLKGMNKPVNCVNAPKKSLNQKICLKLKQQTNGIAFNPTARCVLPVFLQNQLENRLQILVFQ